LCPPLWKTLLQGTHIARGILELRPKNPSNGLKACLLPLPKDFLPSLKDCILSISIEWNM